MSISLEKTVSLRQQHALENTPVPALAPRQLKSRSPLILRQQEFSIGTLSLRLQQLSGSKSTAVLVASRKTVLVIEVAPSQQPAVAADIPGNQ